MTRAAKVPRCLSCRWWERSSNFKSEERDWGLCHLWGGRSGHISSGMALDYTFGHEPRGSDTCEYHNADPVSKEPILQTGKMPILKTEGEFS